MVLRSSFIIALLLPLAGCATLGASTPAYVAETEAEAALASPPGGAAAEDAAEAVALLAGPDVGEDDLLRLADLANPEVAAARAAAGAAAGAAWQAGLFPNPTLELEVADMPAREFGFHRSQNTVALIQTVPVGGRIGAAETAAEAEIGARLRDLEAVRRRVAGDVRLGFVDLIYARRAAEFYREARTRAEETRDIARARFEARAAPESEVIRAEVEVAGLDAAIGRTDRQLAASVERLSALLGGARLPLDRIRGELPEALPALDFAVLATEVRERHPEILAARCEAEAARHRLDQARLERIPDPELRLAWGRNTDENRDVIEAGIAIPLPIFDRNQGRIREAEFDVRRADAEIAAALSRMLRDLSEAYGDYMSAREEAAVLGERVVPAAGRALDQAREGYRAGRVEFLDLLDAQRTLQEARERLVDLARDLGRADARIRQIVGEYPRESR